MPTISVQKIESRLANVPAWKYAALFGALAVALSVYARFTQLSAASYWLDEMSSIHFSTRGWAGLLWDNSPPLYHFLLKHWILLFGTDEAATRSLSGIFSTLVTLLWIHRGYKNHGWQGAMVFGLLHATFAISIELGRQTRMYSLFELEATLFWFAIADLIMGKSVRWYQIAIPTILMLGTHYLSVVPITFGSAALAWHFRKELGRKKVFFGATLVLLISFVPVFLIRHDYLLWQTVKFNLEPLSRWPFKMLLDLNGGALGLAALVVGLFFGLFSRHKDLRVAAIFISSTLVAATVGVQIADRSIFMPRYFIYLVPPWLGLLGGIYLYNKDAASGFRRHFTTALILLALFAQANAIKPTVRKVNPPWREAAVAIGNFPNSLVYTTKALSMQSPYFDSKGIEFRKLNLQFSDQNSRPFRDVESEIEKNRVIKTNSDPSDDVNTKTIWFLENFMGYQNNKENFSRFLQSINCRGDTKRLQNDRINSVYFIRVICD